MYWIQMWGGPDDLFVSWDAADWEQAFENDHRCGIIPLCHDEPALG